MYRDVPPLPLDSPRWATLSSPEGSSADVPALLRAVAGTRPLRIVDIDGPWSRLVERLYHQGTIGGTACASFPHLVVRAEQADQHDRQELCVVLGWIAAARGRMPVPEDIEIAYRAALPAAAELTVGLLADGPIHSDSAHLFAFGALAMIGHPAACLGDANLDPSAPPGVECECRSCGAGYMVALLPDGIARRMIARTLVAPYARSPKVADTGQPPLELPPAPRDETTPTVWTQLGARLKGRAGALGAHDAEACMQLGAAACRAGIDARTDIALVLIVVAATVMSHGNLQHGRQLTQLAGPVLCPRCDQVASLTSQMLDFQDLA